MRKQFAGAGNRLLVMISVLALLVCSITMVATADGDETTLHEPTGNYYGYGVYRRYAYRSPIFVQDGGKNYVAYCFNFQKHMTTGQSYTYGKIESASAADLAKYAGTGNIASGDSVALKKMSCVSRTTDIRWTRAACRRNMI